MLRRLDVESKVICQENKSFQHNDPSKPSNLQEKKRKFCINKNRRLNALCTINTGDLPRKPKLPPHQTVINIDMFKPSN